MKLSIGIEDLVRAQLKISEIGIINEEIFRFTKTNRLD